MSGPQKRLWQYAGVAIATRTGFPVATASATVSSFISGIGSTMLLTTLMWAPSRSVRCGLPGSASPTCGSGVRSRTLNGCTRRRRRSPSISASSSAPQSPVRSKSTLAWKTATSSSSWTCVEPSACLWSVCWLNVARCNS